MRKVGKRQDHFSPADGATWKENKQKVNSFRIGVFSKRQPGHAEGTRKTQLRKDERFRCGGGWERELQSLENKCRTRDGG